MGRPALNWNEKANLTRLVQLVATTASASERCRVTGTRAPTAERKQLEDRVMLDLGSSEFYREWVMAIAYEALEAILHLQAEA